MIVIGILVLVILLFLLFNYLKKRSVIISGVKYFNYSYTVGYHYEASVFLVFNVMSPVFCRNKEIEFKQE